MQKASPSVSESSFTVDGVDCFVTGSGPHTVVMIHGWPDTYRLWDSTVEALRGSYRCVRFTLPGFDVAKTERAMSQTKMTALFSKIVDAASPDQAVTLLLHDWGCIFGYEYAAKHPDRVARIVAVDIGDHNSDALQKSLTAKAKWQIFAYQFWLAIAWKLGGTLGDRMTRNMARAMRCTSEPSVMGWKMNYPYAMKWFGLLGGFRSAAQVSPTCPLLYIYGERKPFMFHSLQWIKKLSERPDCAIKDFRTGHWVMLAQPAEFNQCVADWLAKSAP